MYIKANGIAFSYQVDGAQDAPWLIFSNSLATNLSMWDDQVRVLGGRFRVLRYDQRGHDAASLILGCAGSPEPAIRLSKKDWLLRADRAVLCPVPGAYCTSGSCPAGFFAEVGLRRWRWSRNPSRN
jgi:pimeloyl-ACP methyl ester carboxylesterase